MKKIKIGRNPDCDFVVESLSVSRKHAELIVADGKVRITDLNSNNGTYIIQNGEKTSVKNAFVELEDILWFGKSGPYKVKDIIFACKHSTEIFDPSILRNDPSNSGSYKNRSTQGLMRCKSCGSIIEIDSSICPECGRVVS